MELTCEEQLDKDVETELRRVEELEEDIEMLQKVKGGLGCFEISETSRKITNKTLEKMIGQLQRMVNPV